MAMAMAGGPADSYDLDALAVSDRFRLFNFTRRDDYHAYLWVLRAMDRLRGMHVAQSHTDDVGAVLGELAAVHDGVPPNVGTARIWRSRACSPRGCRTRTCLGWCSPTSCGTCVAWRRRIATAMATRSCAAWPASTG